MYVSYTLLLSTCLLKSKCKYLRLCLSNIKVFYKIQIFSSSKNKTVAETPHMFQQSQPGGISLFCISCYSIPNLAFSSRLHLAWKLTEHDARSFFSKAGHCVPVPLFGIGRHQSALFMLWPKKLKRKRFEEVLKMENSLRLGQTVNPKAALVRM